MRAARDRSEHEHHDGGRLEGGKHEQARIGRADRGRRIGQVDLVHHAEDQREPDAEQRIGRAEQHAVNDRLNGVDQIKIIHGVDPDPVGMESGKHGGGP